MTEYLSVSTLTKYLKRKFDVDPYLERVYLTGEISNFRLGRYYYQYFSLKDEKASINAQIPTRDFERLDFSFANDMKVLCIGRVSLNDKRNQLTFTVEKIVPDGVGELALKLEQLKKKLSAEGLFDESHKKPLPQFSRRIGVVTASSGAVIHDIITTVNKRFPLTEVVLFPSKVSGVGSVEELVATIEAANDRADIDLLIVGRGGGSLEDLWSFNEEAVVRAIYNSRIPVISSVGHETDTTLADFVADVRAATPTAAATFATPNTKADLLLWLAEAESRERQAFSNLLGHLAEKLRKLSNAVVFRQPERLYDAYAEKLDRLTEKLSVLTERQLSNEKHRFERLQLIENFEKLYQVKKSRYEKSYQGLLLLDVKNVKARGFAIVTKNGKIVKKVADIVKNDVLNIELIDGSVEAHAD